MDSSISAVKPPVAYLVFIVLCSSWCAGIYRWRCIQRQVSLQTLLARLLLFLLVHLFCGPMGCAHCPWDRPAGDQNFRAHGYQKSAYRKNWKISFLGYISTSHTCYTVQLRYRIRYNYGTTTICFHCAMKERIGVQVPLGGQIRQWIKELKQIYAYRISC